MFISSNGLVMYKSCTQGIVFFLVFVLKWPYIDASKGVIYLAYIFWNISRFMFFHIFKFMSSHISRYMSSKGLMLTNSYKRWENCLNAFCSQRVSQRYTITILFIYLAMCWIWISWTCWIKTVINTILVIQNCYQIVKFSQKWLNVPANNEQNGWLCLQNTYLNVYWYLVISDRIEY